MTTIAQYRKHKAELEIQLADAKAKGHTSVVDQIKRTLKRVDSAIKLLEATTFK